MRDVIQESIQSLRANKLRSFLTMFGILWGVVSIVVLSATGEGFRLGNEQVLREFGANIAIVWGRRTSLQVGGERAGREVRLTRADARAIQRESRLVARLSPEINRDVRVKSLYNSATVMVHGVEPAYQEIRTIQLEYGRPFNWDDERSVNRVAIVGSEMSDQLFGNRRIADEPVTLNGLPFRVVGKIRKKDQDSSYSGVDDNKIFVPFSTMLRDFPRADAAAGTLSQIIVSPHDWVVEEMPELLAASTGRLRDVRWPLAKEVRAILARRHGFDPDDTEAVTIWDTSVESLLFERIILYMRQFFSAVGLVTLALGGIGVMNIMLIAVRERTREIGIRKALGATARTIQRQFFLEGFFLTMASGTLGLLIALGLCALINLLPMPGRFVGMVVTWQTAAAAVTILVAIGAVSSTYPARRAAALAPVQALRYDQ